MALRGGVKLLYLNKDEVESFMRMDEEELDNIYPIRKRKLDDGSGSGSGSGSGDGDSGSGDGDEDGDGDSGSGSDSGSGDSDSGDGDGGDDDGGYGGYGDDGGYGQYDCDYLCSQQNYGYNVDTSYCLCDNINTSSSATASLSSSNVTGLRTAVSKTIGILSKADSPPDL